MILLDRGTAVAPTIRGTWFLSLVTSLVEKVAGRNGSTAESTTRSETDGGDESEDGSTGLGSEGGGSGTVTPREEGGPTKGKMGRASATTMAGGRRRKGVASRKK